MAASSANINVVTVVKDESLKSLASTIEGVAKVARSATAKLRESADQAADTARKASRVRQEVLLQAANVSQLYLGLRSAVSGLQGVLGSYADTYNNAAVASKKLEVVMRQRMDATEDDIKSIKAVTNAQKELGVIGGSVQNAGAQQVATFLTQSSTLRTLIPAMNNLLAQQKGVNASQEDAVGIGNLMGKAMQGQTSALRRVGITFSEAEEQILKYGTESERAATLAKVITNNVGEMNAKLAQTDAGKMKQLQNAFGGIKYKIGQFVTDYGQYLAAASQVGILVASVIQLKTVLVSAVGMVKSFGLTLISTLRPTNLLALAQRAASAATATLAFLQKGLASSLGISTIAARGLSVALMGVATLGVGLAIQGLIGMMGGLGSVTKEATENSKALQDRQTRAAESQNAFTETAAKARQEITKEIEKIKGLKNGTIEAKDAVARLNAKYGASFGHYNTVNEWYKALTENVTKYAEALGYAAQMESLGSQLAKVETEREIAKDQENRHRGEKEYSKNIDWSNDRNVTDFLPRAVEGLGYMASGRNFSDAFETKKTTSSNYKYWSKERSRLDDEKKSIEQRMELTRQKMQEHQGNQPKGGSGTKLEKLKKKKGETTEQRLAKEIRAEKEKNDRINKMADEAASYSKKREDERNKKAFEVRQNAINLMWDGKEKELAQNRLNYDRALQDEANYQREQLEQAQDHADKMWELDARNKDAVARGRRNPQKLTSLDLPASDKIQSHLRVMSAQTNYNKTNTDTTKKYAAPARLQELHTVEELTKAISHYQDASNKQSGDELYNTQRTIAAHEEKLTKLRNTSELLRELQEVRDIEGLDDREMRVKIRAIGFDELTSRIQRVQKQLTDPRSPIGDAQRKDLQALIATYSHWRAVSVKSIGTVKTAWGGVQGIGDSINGIAESLEGSASAWQKLTSVINGFFGIVEGVRSVVEVARTIGIVSKANAAAKAIETTAHYANASAVTAEGAAVVSASAAKSAANKVEATTAVTAAASQTFAAHAGIPFVGIALGAGMVAAMLATMLTIPKFADGGIAYGPTLGLFGEYAGASHNPEVVAPLDKLRSLITPQGGAGGRVEFRIEGRHLVGVLNKESRHHSRNY